DVVGAPGDLPAAVAGGLELREVELPHLVAVSGRVDERRPPGLRELATFSLIARRLRQIASRHGSTHRALRHRLVGMVEVVQRPDLAVPPRGELRSELRDGRLDPLHRRRRPWALRGLPGQPAGSLTGVGAARDLDQLSEPRDAHAGVGPDHLEVLDGGSSSAERFHTRSSTWASPSAAFTSSSSASSARSRLFGPGLPPSATPWRPASMNWRFQFDTDCSDTFALRAASATLISPARTDSTSRVFSSGGNALGRGIRTSRVRSSYDLSRIS